MQYRHSGLGIASLLLALVTGVMMFVLIAAAGYIEVTTPGGIDEESATAVMLGLGLIGVGLLDVLAVILGIAALLQPERRKVLAVLGLVIGAGSLLGMAGLMVLGAFS